MASHCKVLYITAIGVFVVLGVQTAGYASDEGIPSDTALGLSQIRPGVCVHLGATDGRLEIQLTADGRNLVHGLALDNDSLDNACRAIQGEAADSPLAHT